MKMVDHSLKKMIALLVVRILIVLGFQLIFILALSWEEAIPWWPFSMIATEIVCLVILILLLKREKKSLKSIQLMPFDSFLKLGKISEFLNGKPSTNPFVNFFRNVLVFIILVALLGVPAIAFNNFLSHNIPVLENTNTIGQLPDWALYLMIVFLPLTQALVEFPWFYGYIYPRLETYFETKIGNQRNLASIKALSIVLFFFVLQLALIPLILNPGFIFWRLVAFIPLLFVIGFTTRLVPRFMLGFNILHAFMALNVVLEFWKMK